MAKMRLLLLSIALLFTVGAATQSFAKGRKGYHCEVKKNGKTKDLSTDEAPNRKACKDKGGKWVKGHDHDHGEEGADHDHDE